MRTDRELDWYDAVKPWEYDKTAREKYRDNYAKIDWTKHREKVPVEVTEQKSDGG